MTNESTEKRTAKKIDLESIYRAAHLAVLEKDWLAAKRYAEEALKEGENDAEGLFLAGIVDKATGRVESSIGHLSLCTEIYPERYDAATELAELLIRRHKYADAARLIEERTDLMSNSPKYLNLSAEILLKIGLPESAWPLVRLANRIQPNTPRIESNMAECAVYVGRINAAINMYRSLLERFPRNQRFHYALSKINIARDRRHIRQMLQVSKRSRDTPERNIYVNYALGKEYEDLKEWDKAFVYFKRAGDAAARLANYCVQGDLNAIQAVIDECNEKWFSSTVGTEERSKNTPIFVVGLPRSGSTLVDRSLSLHSQIESIGETFSVPLAICQMIRRGATNILTSTDVKKAATRDLSILAELYMKSVQFRLGDKPYFIEKLPENINNVGFLARAFPHCKIIHVRRNPMDNCFALYKQSYFRYAYSLDDLAQYYAAYDRLCRHWRSLKIPNFLELSYETLVHDFPGTIKLLLEKLDLPVEERCERPSENRAAVATASAVQVRKDVHTNSVGTWKRYRKRLKRLKSDLEKQGVDLSESLRWC